MKKVIMLCVGLGALLALSAPAFAQGDMELSWGACKGDGGAQTNVDFPCDAGSGVQATLYGTFSNAPAQPSLISMDGQLDLRTVGALPTWWRVRSPAEPANCNPGALFGDELPATGCTAGNLCGDFPANGADCDVSFGAISDNSDPALANNRLKMLFSVFRTSTISAAASTRYFVFKIAFYSNFASESGGACVGCTDQAALVFNRLGLLAPVLPGNEDFELQNFDCATWNGGTSICEATPTQNKTWGALKTLYR